MRDKMLNFRLKSIEEISFEESSKGVDVSEVAFSFFTQTFVDVESEEVRVKGGVMYRCGEREALKLEMFVTFAVESLGEIVTIDDESKEINFKVDIIPTFISSAIGVMRGVIFEKTKGSSLADVPFPLIPMDHLIKNNTIYL